MKIIYIAKEPEIFNKPGGPKTSATTPLVNTSLEASSSGSSYEELIIQFLVRRINMHMHGVAFDHQLRTLSSKSMFALSS